MGREYEIQRLEEIAASDRASIIVVYGRRRVGKTTLLHRVFDDRNLIRFEGLENQPQSRQLEHFTHQLSARFNDPKLAKLKLTNWVEAFTILNDYVQSGTWTVYLEELQWLANYEHTLISDLKYVWDNFFEKNRKLILILCGSSPSFMIEKVMRSKALYNRSQHELPIGELDFERATQLLPATTSIEEKLDEYLAVGGIPLDMRQLSIRSSVYLSLCSLCFEPGGFFSEEADRIFAPTLPVARVHNGELPVPEQPTVGNLGGVQLLSHHRLRRIPPKRHNRNSIGLPRRGRRRLGLHNLLLWQLDCPDFRIRFERLWRQHAASS